MCSESMSNEAIKCVHARKKFARARMNITCNPQSGHNYFAGALFQERKYYY